MIPSLQGLPNWEIFPLRIETEKYNKLPNKFSPDVRSCTSILYDIYAPCTSVYVRTCAFCTARIYMSQWSCAYVCALPHMCDAYARALLHLSGVYVHALDSCSTCMYTSWATYSMCTAWFYDCSCCCFLLLWTELISKWKSFTLAEISLSRSLSLLSFSMSH